METKQTAKPKPSRKKSQPAVSAEAAILGGAVGIPSKMAAEKIVDPISIISKAAIDEDITEDEIDRQFNDVERTANNPAPGVMQMPDDVLPTETTMINRKTTIDELNEIAAAARPNIRKVVIKKISRFKFKLGMERLTKENLNLIPGTAHSWVCDKKGNHFVTGFDNHPEDRARLEKILRVDLGPTSPYWSTLVFRLEDKEHGMILNFDDAQLGAYYETVYFAMLGSSLIANGYQEYKSGAKSTAEWFIEDKEAESEAKQADMTHDIEAMDMFKTMSFDKRRAVAKIIGPDAGISPWGGSDKVVSTDLWDFIKKNSINAKRFVDVASKNDIEIQARVVAKDAIKLNVIRKNKANEYVYADISFGPSEDHIVAKIALPQFSTIRQAILTQIQAKKR